jgi:hypothetical protein
VFSILLNQVFFLCAIAANRTPIANTDIIAIDGNSGTIGVGEGFGLGEADTDVAEGEDVVVDVGCEEGIDVGIGVGVAVGFGFRSAIIIRKKSSFPAPKEDVPPPTAKELSVAFISEYA